MGIYICRLLFSTSGRQRFCGTSDRRICARAPGRAYTLALHGLDVLVLEVTSFVLWFRVGSRKRRVLAHAQAQAAFVCVRACVRAECTVPVLLTPFYAPCRAHTFRAAGIWTFSAPQPVLTAENELSNTFELMAKQGVSRQDTSGSTGKAWVTL